MTEVSSSIKNQGSGAPAISSKWDQNSKYFQQNIIVENLEESNKGESNGTGG
jgi:hypothetical protein